MINKVKRTIESIMITFKLILFLNNNWEEFKLNNKYKIRDVEIKEVEKDEENGFFTYICEDCGETKRISHSCKSHNMQ